MLDRITGCILGAAVGDAMGAPAEAKSPRQIEKQFGGRLEDFAVPPQDVQARGRKAGQVTDAFSIPYMLTEEILSCNGKVSRHTASEALLKWGDSEWFEPFAGMTTRKAVIRMNEQKQMNTWDYIGHLGNKLFKGHYYALSSNGAAVKAYPAALFAYGDMETAIENAVEISMSSHDDPYSVSGACCAAAAVCEALRDGSTVYSVIKAAQYGAETGEERARGMKDICVYPGPSVSKRLEMAIEIALHYNVDPVSELRDRIGSGPAIAETVPTAMGILVAGKGDTMKCIRDAVNIGDETSATAAIAGAICGSMHGARSFPEGYLEFIEKQNGFGISSQAEAVASLWRDNR